MKRLIFAIVILGLHAETRAGELEPVLPGNNVHINLVIRQAFGVLSHARNSPNSDERIFCSSNINAGGQVGVCTFRMSSTQWAGCVTDNPAMISAIESLGGDDQIFVSWGKDGLCSELSVAHDSGYSPKAH
jgi:hypothetical protein